MKKIESVPPETQKKPILTRVFAFFLVCLGTPLEAYYYWYSFTKEGVPTPVAVVAALGLILLLSVAVYFSKERPQWYVLAFFVAAYSVSATATGQGIAYVESSVNKKNAARNISYAESDLKVIGTDKERISLEYSRLDAQWALNEEERIDKKETIQRLDAEYSLLTDTTVDGVVTSRKTERDSNRVQRREADRSIIALDKANKSLMEQKTARVAELETLRLKEEGKRRDLEAGSVAESYDIYRYYADIVAGRLPAEEALRLVRHLFLSVLLMLMSPAGVKLYGAGGSSIRILSKEKKAFRWSNPFKKNPIQQNETPDTKLLWDQLPDPAPLRPAAKAVGVSHTMLYDAAAHGDIRIVGNPKRVEKKELRRFMAERGKQ